MARTKGSANKISFFSESDIKILKNGKKVIASEYPTWYNREVVDELQEDIRRDEYALRNGFIKESQIPQVRERLKGMQDKLDEINGSLPKLTAKQKDSMKTAIEYLGNEIKDKMFTRDQMVRGLADSYEEAKRMITPSINVTAEVAELAEACNVKPRSGKISRDEASKIWKISRRSLDEMSDCEELRR
jgi:predicted nuclease with TOPRIM domain